jgi:hypothetical protein
MFRRLAAVSLVLALTLLLSGCAGKVTKANFDKITNGMSLSEVEAILGKGERNDGDGSNVAAQVGVDVGAPAKPRGFTSYIWQSGDKSIEVQLTNDKVTGKIAKGL